jgi:hypothetical protein
MPSPITWFTGLHHAFEHGVEELPRFLRVAIGQELHRALEVGEEDGDLLALSFDGGLGGEDFLSEVLRSVGLGRHKPDRNRSGCHGEPVTALTTKVIVRRGCCAALRTRDV